MRRVLTAFVLLLVALATHADAAWAADIDSQHTQIGFTLKTRWGLVLQGRFPNYSGGIDSLPDGRLRTRLVMSARDAEIIGHANYTQMLRGRGFFEADRFPEVEFVSDPYPASLLTTGGALKGQLRIRNRRRAETFTLEPGTCARPAYDCDVLASGSVRRSDYGVDRWMLAISDRVRFVLRLRVRGDAQ